MEPDVNCMGRDRSPRPGSGRLPGRGLAVIAALLAGAGATEAAEVARYGYCTWASPAPGQEAIVSAIYAVPVKSGSVRLARGFADYINAGRRDRPRSFAPVCFSEFDSEEAARHQRNRELAEYRQRGFTIHVVGGWQPAE
jgi:hypothetical protein